MKLIKLYSNKSTFKDIIFNPSGLSIIYAEKTSMDRQSTFNGTGKTLSIELVDFCLGSDYKEKFKLLLDWEFFLDFEVDDKVYTVKRNTFEEKMVYLNNEPLNLTKYRKFLFDICTNYHEKIKGITFRNILSKFLKYSESQYIDPIMTSEKFMHQAIYRDSFLLGLDSKLCLNKINNREMINKKEEAIREIKRTEIYNTYSFEKNKDLKLKIQNLKSDIKELDNKLNNFKIAEDYTEIQERYNELIKTKNSYQNELYLYKKRLNSIKESLDINADIEYSTIINFYEQMKLEIPDMVKKNIEQVSNFHNSLIKNRQLRLSESKCDIEKQIGLIDENIKTCDKKINDYYIKLSVTTSFSEYSSMQKKLREKESELLNLENIHSIIDESEKEITKITSDMLLDDIKTDEYLHEKSEYIEFISSKYMDFAKKIYNNSVAGLDITNDKGLKNKIRYNIVPSIECDKSGGIGFVKMYLYDLLLLTLQKNHNIEFLFNDQRIFGEVDPRQVVNLIKLLIAVNIEGDFQFIFTINNNLFNEIIIALDDNDKEDLEIKNYLHQSIVLSLNDKGDEGKLLGVTIDLKENKKSRD